MSGRLRLVHFVEQGAVVGGVERYLAHLLAAELEGLEHAVVLDREGACAFAGRWPVQAAPWSAESGAASAEGLARAIGEPGAVCVFHFPPGATALDAARRAGARVALFCHDHRWWCPSATRYYARPERICRIQASGAACAIRYHALHCGTLRPARTLRGFARAALARRALARADAVLTASSFMAAEAAMHGAARPRTSVVPLPVALPEPVPSLHETATPPEVLFVSRLTPEKGVFALLEAFAAMTVPAALALAGTGIAAARVARAVAAHPRADRIRLLGHLDDGGVRAAYARAAVVAVPSRWPEPFGLVGIEALAVGRPVATTGVGGTADWAREELGVQSAATDQPRALAAALDRALAEPIWAERARSAGVRWVRERHSVAAHVAALVRSLGSLAPLEAR